jgi:RHS repeat-associated protein
MNSADWPPFINSFNDPTYSGSYLHLVVGGTTRTGWVFYERGTWDTGYDMTCGGSALSVLATIRTVCYGGSLSDSKTLSLSGCQGPVSCPIDGGGAGGGGEGSARGSMGPGGVPIGPNGAPVRSEAPVAGPLAPTLTYNGNNTQFSNSALSAGWFFDYGETLVPGSASGTLVWTDRLGFRRTYTGSDASGYNASDPKDAHGSIAVVSGNYVLTTPDGVSRTFARGGVGYGYWMQTIDRWGNGTVGNATYNSLTPSTTVQEFFGGPSSLTGRSITLAYTGKRQLTSVQDVNGGSTYFGYDANDRLSKICTADETCVPSFPTYPWRSYSYYGTSTRLTAVTDAGNNVLRGYSYNASFGVANTWVGANAFSDSGAKEKTAYAFSSPTVTVSRFKDDGTTADTAYTVSAVAGLYRVTQVSGACPECGDENATYVYDANGYPTTRLDGNNHTTKRTFDSTGNVTQLVEDFGGVARTTNYAHAAPNEMPSSWSNVKDFWKTKTQVAASVKTSPASDVVTSRTWNTSSLVLTESASGYLTASDSSPTVRSTATTYDATGRITQVDGPRTDVTDVTTFTYYGNSVTPVANRNRLYQQADPVGVSVTFDSYHPLGGVTQQTAKKGTLPTDADVVTQFAYDSRGRLQTRVLKATAGTTEQDLTTTNIYDSRGRLTSTAVKAGSSADTTKTLYAYEDWTDRLLTRTESTAGNGSGDRVTYVYDNQGNVKTETYGYFNGTATSTDYQVNRDFDARCHVASQTFPADNATTQYTHDCVGNLWKVQDSLHTTGANLTYDYDTLNRLWKVSRTISGSQPDVTTYGYDPLDHLTSVTDPNGNATHYVYDDFGGLRQQITTLPGGGPLDVTNNGYDAANNLVSTSNAQRASRRAYDAANRLLAAKSTSGPLTYTLYYYDSGCLPDPTTRKTFGMGRLCRMTDTSGTTTYGYDRRGLVTTEFKSLVGANHTYLPFVYAYDAAGRRTSVTYPTGDRVTTAYSDSGRPVSMTITLSGSSPSTVSSITHKAFGPITGFTTPAGVVESRTFDTRFRRLSQATTLSASTLMGLNYGNGTDPTTGYDKEGNLLALNDTVSSTFNRTFGYHPDRYSLTSSTGPYGTNYASLNLSWTYDPTGNRLTETRGAFTTTYAYGNDGSGHSNGVLTSLTPGGNVTSLITGDLAVDETGATHIYDAFGRPFRVYDPSCRATNFNSFSHDGNGHRAIRMSQACGTPASLKREDYLYSSDGKLLFYEPFNSSDVATAREAYVYLEDEPVAIIRAGTDSGTFFLHNDHLGRPLAMTDTSGTLVWRAEYEPFGKSLAPRTNARSFSPRFRFPGQWENGDSGDLPGGATGILGSINALTDNWYRTYAQRWGRYTQPDPIGVSLKEANLFRYASGNPLGKTDTLGLWTIDKSCECNSPVGNTYHTVAKACSFLKLPSCQAAMGILRVHPAGTSPGTIQTMLGCMNDRCSGKSPWTIVCGSRTDEFGEAMGIMTFLHPGSRTSGSDPDYPQTLFHELMHTCGQPPHGGDYSSSPWQEIEKACTGWPK